MPAGARRGEFGVRPHDKTKTTVATVEQAARCGMTAAEIAPMLQISDATFWRHYKAEFQGARANMAMSMSAKMIRRGMSEATPPTVAQRALEFVLERRFGWHHKNAVEQVGPGGLDDADPVADAMSDIAARLGIEEGGEE